MVDAYKSKFGTAEWKAESLVREAEDVANRYVLSTVGLSSTEQVRVAIVYAWILAGLQRPDMENKHVRVHGSDVIQEYSRTDVVFLAMHARFAMSSDDFATEILGG